jgi:hypothetical protein
MFAWRLIARTQTLDLRRPGTLQKRQHSPDLLVSQYAIERGHVTRVPRWGEGGDAPLGDTEQDIVRMMPSVPRGVMRRGRHLPIRLPLAPVLLTFKLGAMTRRAVLEIDDLAQRHLSRVGQVCLAVVGHQVPDHHGYDGEERQCGAPH